MIQTLVNKAVLPEFVIPEIRYKLPRDPFFFPLRSIKNDKFPLF